MRGLVVLLSLLAAGCSTGGTRPSVDWVKGKTISGVSERSVADGEELVLRFTSGESLVIHSYKYPLEVKKR